MLSRIKFILLGRGGLNKKQTSWSAKEPVREKEMNE
jgi:hypothetical protein